MYNSVRRYSEYYRLDSFRVYRVQGNSTTSNSIMFYRRTEARKNGPIKALQPVNDRDGHPKMALTKSMSQEPGGSVKYEHTLKMSKDDLMFHKQSKEKIVANPYATIKMWRPTSTESSSTGDTSDGDVYQSFTNFDAIRLNRNSRKSRLSSTFDVKSSIPELSYGSQGDYVSLVHRSEDQIKSDIDLINQKDTGQKGISVVNGYEELPADYSRDISPDVILRRDKITDSVLYNEAESDISSVKLENLSLSSPVSISPTFQSLSPISSLASPPQSPQLLPSPPSFIKDSQDDDSFKIVSDGTTNSVKLVLSQTYTDIDLVGEDVELLLAELRLTMNFIKTSTGTTEKNSGQLSKCLSELLSHTKKFIQEAKLVVSSANNNHQKMMHELESAVHTLAHVFLHGQATMLLMASADHAQHLGFQIIKTTNSFKSTLSAANLALGKTLNDPNMKYLMRQAQNLATLLASLIATIKEVQLGRQ